MAPRLWNDACRMGIESIDQQHIKLFELVDTIYANIERKDNDRLMREVVHQMLAYAQDHFTLEERLMKRHGFQGLDEHRAQHRAFVDKVSDLQRRLDDGKLVLSFEVTSFLKAWLVGHIQKSDRAYIECFKSAGVK